MKHLFIFTLLIVAFVQNVNAQFRFGIKAGGDFTNITINESNDSPNMLKQPIGFHIGVVGQRDYCDYFAVQSELSFISNRSTVDLGNTLSSGSQEGKLVLSQLQLPLYAKGKLELVPNMKVYLMCGLFVNYNFAAKLKMQESIDLFDNYMPTTSTEVNNMKLKRFGTGYALEAGIEYGKLNIGIGYKHTFGNMSGYEVLGNSPKPQPTIKMENLNFSAAYFF